MAPSQWALKTTQEKIAYIGKSHNMRQKWGGKQKKGSPTIPELSESAEINASKIREGCRSRREADRNKSLWDLPFSFFLVFEKGRGRKQRKRKGECMYSV